MASYRNKLPAAGGGAVIKSVQRGSATIGSGQSSISITISPIVMSKSVLTISYTANSGASTDVPSTAVCSGRIDSTNGVTFYRATSATQQILIEWQLVEYDTGVSVQRGNISASGTSFSATIVPVDVSKSMVLSYCSPSGSSATSVQAQVMSRIESSISVGFSRPTNFGNISIDWQVVSYV